ncbi:MAG TPA: tRNA (adenosine(37)-N6)-threonylcarbamoyltransferase complex dimerization subunit type 1 TsaB [Xanthobacteraceae bacterium]|nr:tRNA (adenosine(37)-N6)-threonylcarbamoyltransferase complex dimerization subunit type 1 TsaB [Xanthobacteraceae bacterium]
MRVLAIDTALTACAAAVLDTDGQAIIASETLAMQRGHNEALVPLLDRVIEHAGIAFADLARIAVTVGPGSYTGLRVGIAAARAIALVTGSPAIGVSTLAALAAPHVAASETRTIVAAIDARHGHVYFQATGPDGRALVAPRLSTIDGALRAIAARPCLIVGPGAELLAAAWRLGRERPGIDSRACPDIDWVARLGALTPPGSASPKPLYLRQPDARPQDAARLPRQ